MDTKLTKEELFKKAQERFRSWDADDYLKPGVEVNPYILEGIDKFLETFKE